MCSRLKPAFTLLLLAPLIAEYLLGSLSFRQLELFPIMVPIHGGGALLVRELARRHGLGWRGIFFLGLAYAVVEEGLATQSLFNPHYLGLHLLRYGFVPWLGIGAPWTVYVLGLHAVWSIAVPIGLVEALIPGQRLTPWLGRPGIVVTGLVYLLGVALIAFGSWKKEQFMASGMQLSVTALVAVGFVIAAFARFGKRASTEAEMSASTPWQPWALGLVAFACGSLFHLLSQFGGLLLRAAASVTGLLLMPVVVVMSVRAAQKSGRWTVAHDDALMLGGLMVYVWLGFFLTARLHGAASIPGQFFPALVVLGLIFGRFIRRRA